MVHRRAWMIVGLGMAALVGCASGRRETSTSEAPHLPERVAQTADSRPLEARPLYTFSEAEVDRYLRSLHARERDVKRRIVHLARKNIGQPYEIYLLGEFPFEGHDPDPLYCLTRSDCLTHAEHMYAMAMADDWWEFLANLQRIRYRDGQIGMLTRNHYTVAEWNRNNDFLFEDITTRLGNGQVHVPLTQTLRRARFFARFGIGQDVPDEPISDSYVPKQRVPEILDELQDADFVNIVRGDSDAQWCGHTGLIAHGDSVNFLHSARPTVREEPLIDYLESDKRCVGIKILRLRPDAEVRMARARREPRATRMNPKSLAKEITAWPLHEPGFPRDWSHAMQLQSFRLPADAAQDDALRLAMEKADGRARAALTMDEKHRAFAVLDLTQLRYAALRPDAVFYGASVPKICIVAGYFQQDLQRLQTLDAQTELELMQVIKRSDNELAAKYSQIVGLDFLQKMVRDDKYGLYDEDTGGGLWCGKHYGLDTPRVGDPVGDHSHAVTVRQCLRYYLLMEQGKLVNPRVSAKLRQIFRAPDLDFHNTKFVRGLNGRDLTIIRKSGLWENWHLDTARVRHGDHVYLLAGATHHPRGQEYLERMAADLDDFLCPESKPAPARHELIVAETGSQITAKRETVTPGPILKPKRAFNEALLSWNLDVPAGAGAAIELRVGRVNDDIWSPWMRVGDWGNVPSETMPTVASDLGKIDVDYFRSEQLLDRLQYRVLGWSNAPEPVTIAIRRITTCTSDTLGIPDCGPSESAPQNAVPRDVVPRRLPVPFRSQRSASADIAGRICSPTSVAMVMEFRGVRQPTETVAQRAYDATHDIYGNWPRCVQAAYSFGVPGYLTRFSNWDDVATMIHKGQPLIISIRAPQEGMLRNAPYKKTAGHLLVITGFDAAGNVLVNDPAVAPPKDGRLTYYREDLDRVWLQATGGVAYVLLPADRVE